MFFFRYVARDLIGKPADVLIVEFFPGGASFAGFVLPGTSSGSGSLEDLSSPEPPALKI